MHKADEAKEMAAAFDEEQRRWEADHLLDLSRHRDPD
jgi:hypothetical protein